MSDYLQELVDNAVLAFQQGPSKEAFDSLLPLARLDPATLLPELFRQVEVSASDVDMESLRPTDLIPDVDSARKIVHAVVDQDPDMDFLRSIVTGSYTEFVVELISVVAALKASRV